MNPALFGVVADHDVRRGLPIVARATPGKLDMLGESGMQDNSQPIFEGDADDKSEVSISLSGGAKRLRRRPEEDTSDRSENPKINLGDRDAEQRRRPPKSGTKLRFGSNVVDRFRRSKVKQTILQ